MLDSNSSSDLNNMSENLLNEREMDNEKVYERYSKLVKAIEFFSQRFSLESMSEYIFEFSIELLDLNNCTFIVLVENEYKVFKSLREDLIDISFLKEDKHDQLVYFHAGLLNKTNIEMFTSKDVIEHLKPTTGIPIIMDKSLYGFVLFDIGDLSKDKSIIAEALMNLFHLALTNNTFFNKLEISKASLDATIFNLFAINQASKALLSELDRYKLEELALSVFSELSQSALTSIFMYDEFSNHYVCKQCNDVYGNVKFRPIRLEKNKAVEEIMPKLIPCEKDKDMEVFSRFFVESVTCLDYYQPKYIINLVNNDHLIGFITLSERTKEDDYTKSHFELIESLASATYIAISNAIFFEQVNHHKANALKQLERLKRLNRLIKNMNTADDIHSLLELTLDTLKISFGYNASFYAKHNQGIFSVCQRKGIVLDDVEFRLPEFIYQLEKGKSIISYIPDDVASTLAEIMTDNFYSSIQGMLMIPVYIDDIIPELLGILCLFDVNKGVLATDENLLTLETIASHIAPVVKQLTFVDVIKANYHVNYIDLFKKKLQESILEASDTDTRFYIVTLKRQQLSLFNKGLDDELIDMYPYTYKIDNNHVSILCHTLLKSQEVKKTYKQYDLQCIVYESNMMDLEQLLSMITEFVYR